MKTATGGGTEKKDPRRSAERRGPSSHRAGCPGNVGRLLPIVSISLGPLSSLRGARDAVGLRRLEAPRPRERPEDAPGAARREEPVRLAPKRPPELRAQRGARDAHGPRAVGRQALDQRLRDDAADPDAEAKRDGGQRDAEHEPPGVRREAI